MLSEGRAKETQLELPISAVAAEKLATPNTDAEAQRTGVAKLLPNQSIKLKVHYR